MEKTSADTDGMANRKCGSVSIAAPPQLLMSAQCPKGLYKSDLSHFSVPHHLQPQPHAAHKCLPSVSKYSHLFNPLNIS